MTLLSTMNPLSPSQTGQHTTPTHQQIAKAADGGAPSAEAVAPTADASSSGGAGNATSYSGSGAGAGAGAGAGQQHYKSGAAILARTSQATPSSVVDAQVVTGAPALEPRKPLPEIVDTAQMARDVAASLPVPSPTAPILREAKTTKA